MSTLKKHLSVANVLSCLALFVALGGAAYAATALAPKSVKTRHLSKGAVTTQKLRNGAVTAAKLRNGAVIGTKIAFGAVGSNHLLDGGVRSVDLGGGVVTAAKLKDGAVTGEKLATNAVTASKIAADAVTTGKIQEGAVTSAQLAPSFLAQLVKNVAYVAKASPNDSTSPKSVTAECPAGKQAIGGGARLILGTATTVALGESAPSPPNAEGKRTGWTASAHEVPADAESWSIEAHAICAEF
jgi:trimeric autotransporter adhesin